MEPLYGYVCVNCGAIDEFDPGIDSDSDIDLEEIVNELDDTGPLFVGLRGWVEPCVCVGRYCRSVECEDHYGDEPGYEVVVKVQALPVMDAEAWERDHPRVEYFEIFGIKIMPPGTPVTDCLSAVVKSDHGCQVLTIQEEQTFKNYIARYNDPNLAMIVDQHFRTEFDISFDEAASIIRGTGRNVSPDRLRNTLKCYEAYERAIKENKTIVLCFLKFFFVGAPLSGKTSTRRRLIGEIKNLKSLKEPVNSTGIAETTSVVIKKMVSESIAISKPLLWKVIQNKSGSLDDLAQLTLHLITNRAGTERPDAQANKLSAVLSTGTESRETHTNMLTVVVPTEQPTTSTVTVSSQSATESDQELSMHMVDTQLCTLIEIDMAFEQLDNVIKSGNFDKQLDELAMANMIDVGGQPAFLEMVPVLTVGPALYFIFFRLDQELQKLYEVHFCTKENKDILLQSSYCIETVIFQLLSTITCFSLRLSENKSSSHALLFGTFRDKVTQNNVRKIEESLKDKLRTTSFYKESLIKPTRSGKLVFTVDNMDGEESEISGIQRRIEAIMETSFEKTPLPVSWLVFRFILQSLQKPIVGLADCQIIGKRLHMATPVEELLWFLHHDTGILLYYRDIPSMKNVVICDPQVVYNCVSELIIETFKRGTLNATLIEVDDFHDKGQFTLSSLREKTKDISSYLSLDQIIDILKYHNIIAALHSADETKKRFIMFAVLQSASAEELQNLFERKCQSEYNAGPLLIHFECGYVPYGVFCAAATHLIAHQDAYEWLLCQEKMKKNMVTFCVDRAFHVTLMSHPQYLEVQILQQNLAHTRKSLNEVCISVKEIVTRALNTVIEQMKYKPYGSPLISMHSPFKFAFPCSLKDHDNHLMTVKNEGKEWFAECIGGSHIELILNKEQLIWFADQSKSATCKRLKLDDSSLPEVEHHLLDLIEWKSDRKGKIKIVQVYLSSAHQWKTIASRLGIERERIMDIERQGNGRSEIEYHITEVFQHWLDNAINLPNANKYPKMWKGLIALLNDSNCGELANKLNCALKSPYSNVRNTLY